MNKAFEKILEFIDKQIKIEESIAKSESEGHPITHQYGANCMNVIKKFVQEVAKEYKNGHFGCNFNGEHEKCKDCCITNCKKRNAIWFGLDVPDTNVGNKWIPCSERLPEAGKRYLVSAIWKDKDFEKSAVYDAVYGSDGLWHSYNYDPVSYKVIAWQPLPEPFKESEDIARNNR